MDLIKEHIHILTPGSSLAIEFKNDTWMRIYPENGKLKWYNSNSPHQTIIFQNASECFRVLELSIQMKITEIVLNTPQKGNEMIYPKGLDLLCTAMFPSGPQ